MAQIRMFLWLLVLTGIIYPLVVLGIAQLLFHHKANGQIITQETKEIGSRLIAQKFTKENYFWPRPSAIDYNPLPSGGSNLGPTSQVLKKAIKESLQVYKTKEVPSELLYTSGSGLDPHISLEAAYFQIDRIAKARKIDNKKLEELVNNQSHSRSLGLFGEPYVNVLELNLALDHLN